MRRPPREVTTVVVGGGPAGAACAITLAEANSDVLVLDRAEFPRDKTCGDGITTWALRLLEELEVDLGTIDSFTPVGRIHLSSPSGRVVSYRLPDDPGTYAGVARRTDLDAAVLDRARGAGAEVVTSRRCVGAEQLGDRVRVDLDDGTTVECTWLVGADGMWSPTRRFLGTASPGYRGDWHGLRQYVADVAPAARTDLFVWFEPDILPGYVWSFPVDGGANVGFGLRRDGRWRIGAMGQLWRELLARPAIASVLGPDARPEGPTRAWPIPADLDHAPLSAGRAMWVGDAAGAADPMTGEGIGQALATGIWAAEAILGAADPLEMRHAYDRSVHRDLALDHKMADVLASALSHRKGARVAIALTDLNSWTRDNFVRWLFEDEPRAALLTPRRWHRHFLSRPGAYVGHESAFPRLSPPGHLHETQHL